VNRDERSGAGKSRRDPAPSRQGAYEPPRILAKRPVEQVTLSFNEPVTPGGGIGEQP